MDEVMCELTNQNKSKSRKSRWKRRKQPITLIKRNIEETILKYQVLTNLLIELISAAAAGLLIRVIKEC
jgi:hypothetical protein